MPEDVNPYNPNRYGAYGQTDQLSRMAQPAQPAVDVDPHYVDREVFELAKQIVTFRDVGAERALIEAAEIYATAEWFFAARYHDRTQAPRQADLP